DLSGAPIAGAVIVVRPEIGESEMAWLRDTGKERSVGGKGSTGADGRFSIGVSAGAYEIEISGGGMATAVVGSASPGDDVGDVGLPKATPASGVVVDSRGRGVAGAWVTLTAEDRDDESAARFTTTVRTDGQGRWTAADAASPIFATEAIAEGSPLDSAF